MAPVKAAAEAGKLMYGLFKPECFDLYFNKHEFLDPTCLKLLISKLLGYAIVAGSSIVKVPQIMKLISSQSAASLAPSMFVLEVIGYTIVAAYNARSGYPFSTYGESVFLLIQGWLLVYLIFKCNRSINSAFIACMVAYIAFAYSCTSMSMASLASLQTLSIPLFAASKVPQIYSNFKNSSTGQLSFITTVMNAAGTVARIFTTIQEVKDPIILGGTVLGSVLNIALLVQMGMYWNSTNKQSIKQSNNQTNKPAQVKSAESLADDQSEGVKQRKRRSNKD